MTKLLVAAFCALLFACSTPYPHDPAVCTSDADCAKGHQCLQNWEHTDAGCLSTTKACQKPCSQDSDCSYCGVFGVCAVDSCDTSGPKTCGVFCGDAK